MQIEINDNRNLGEIQDDFSKAFPFLKMVFFNTSDGKMPPGERHFMIRNSHVKIGQYSKVPATKRRIIFSDQTVSDLEKFFKEQYNLNIQILRKSGKVWLETSATGNWTLSKQNSEGEQLCSTYNPE